MHRSIRAQITAPRGMEVAPLADVAFLLMTFFLVVVDPTLYGVKELELPRAGYATPYEPAWRRVRVDIDRHGDVFIHGRRHALPEIGDHLVIMRWWTGRGKPIRGYTRPIPITIRADRATEFHHVANVLELCGKAGPAWVVELAAARPRGERE